MCSRTHLVPEEPHAYPLHRRRPAGHAPCQQKALPGAVPQACLLCSLEPPPTSRSVGSFSWSGPPAGLLIINHNSKPGWVINCRNVCLAFPESRKPEPGYQGTGYPAHSRYRGRGGLPGASLIRGCNGLPFTLSLSTLLGVSVRMFPGSLTETGRHALNVGSTIPRVAVPD